MTHNPYAPPTAPVNRPDPSPDPGATPASGPVGLGGWLVLVCIGLFFTIGQNLLLILQTFVPIFRDGTWQALTTPGSEVYHPLWMPLIGLEIIWNCTIIAWSIHLLVLFFRKSRRFPLRFIVFPVASAGFIVLDAALFRLVDPETPMFDSETLRELSRSVIYGLIWIPYMLRSVRVKNTFVGGGAT